MKKALLLLSLLLPSVAMAGECSDRSAESGLLFCRDFDDLSDCTTGRETTCWTDNSFIASDLTTADYFSIQSGSAAVGSGKIKATGDFGGADYGYTSHSITSSTTVNYRFYVKFTDGWATYSQTHGPGVKASGSGDCEVGGTTELSLYNYFSYHTRTSCVGSTFNLVPNQASPPVMRNNKWYRVEIQQKMDTTGSNGEYRMWIDGTKVTEYTNVDFEGASRSATFVSLWGPRAYFHARIPEWTPSIEFDNMIAFSGLASGTQIGAASGQNADLGTADTTSPYFIQSGLEPFFELDSASENVRHFDDDCSQPSGHKSITRDAILWGTAATIESTQNAAGVADGCADSPAVTDGSLYVNLTSTNTRKGFYWSKPTGGSTSHLFTMWCNGGKIYLSSANDYATAGAPPLSGFRDYANAAGNGCPDLDYSNYISLTVTTDGDWGVSKRYCPTSGTQSVIDSNVDVVEDQWVPYELCVNDSGDTVSLAVDTGSGMTWVIDGQAAGVDISWMFDSSGNNGPIVGATDFQGTAPFAFYVDEAYASSMSFWDCDKGWDAASCPFSSGGSSSSNIAVIKKKKKL